MNTSRRNFIGKLSALPLMQTLHHLMLAAQTTAANIERIIFFYHPDGTQLDAWQPASNQGAIANLGESLSPLAPYANQLRILRNLNIGDGRGDGHPEPASMLLTGALGSRSASIDVQIADYFESPLIHLGVQASKNGGSSISFNEGGSELVADDSPISTAKRFLNSTSGGSENQLDDFANLDITIRETEALLAELSGPEKTKLNEHLKQLKRLNRGGSSLSCDSSSIDLSQYSDSNKHIDKEAPKILDLQMKIMVEALKCGNSKVATLQFSRHTSEIKMDFDWLANWNGQYPMHSHEASHNNGGIHAQQKKWVNTQVAALARMMNDEPEPSGKSGTMLDHSLIVVVTEVSNGASHSRQNMPFYLLGGSRASSIAKAGIYDCQGANHASFLSSLSKMIGMPAQGSYAGYPVLRNLFS